MMDTLDITIPIQPKYNFKKNSILYKVSFKEIQIILLLPNKRKLICFPILFTYTLWYKW